MWKIMKTACTAALWVIFSLGWIPPQAFAQGLPCIPGLTCPSPDTTPPTVSITSPASGATVSGTINVTANASDNVGVAGVQFQLDGANLGAEMTASPYSTSWNTTTASNGSHTLTAIARDTAGNRTTSSPATVTASNTTTTTAAKWTGSGYVNVTNGTAYFAFKVLRGTDGTLSGSLAYYNNVDGFTYNSSSISSLTVTGNKAVI